MAILLYDTSNHPGPLKGRHSIAILVCIAIDPSLFSRLHTLLRICLRPVTLTDQESAERSPAHHDSCCRSIYQRRPRRRTTARMAGWLDCAVRTRRHDGRAGAGLDAKAQKSRMETVDATGIYNAVWVLYALPIRRLPRLHRPLEQVAGKVSNHHPRPSRRQYGNSAAALARVSYCDFVSECLSAVICTTDTTCNNQAEYAIESPPAAPQKSKKHGKKNHQEQQTK